MHRLGNQTLLFCSFNFPDFRAIFSVSVRPWDKLPFFWLMLVGSLLFSSCEVVNPSEEVPAYLKINQARVMVDETTGQTTDTGIKDIWLYHAGFLQGIYPINSFENPTSVTVPYLLVSDSAFFLEGGIFESGLSTFHLPYPFWGRLTYGIQQTPGDTFEISPIFHYLEDSDMEIEVREDFEDISFSLIPFSSSLSEPDSTYFVRSTDAFTGNYSGYVDFGSDDRWFEVINASPFTLRQDEDIYAEITYKSTVEFTVGMIYQGVNGLKSETVITVLPKTEWNTIYVHLISQVRNIINQNGEFTNFWLWLRADGEGNDGYIYLDNVRLIHQK